MQAASDAHVVASDQLNDVDRELQAEPKQRAADAGTDAAIPAATDGGDGRGRGQGNDVRRIRFGSSESTTWDQTSLIGKIFIAFGALLTMASAARMFMA